MIDRIISWDGNWKEKLLPVNTITVETKTIRNMRLTAMRKICRLNALFVEIVSQILLLPSTIVLNRFFALNMFPSTLSICL